MCQSKKKESIQVLPKAGYIFLGGTYPMLNETSYTQRI